MNFDVLCRGCGVEQKDLKPLFGASISQMMQDVTNLEIAENDSFPQQVCRSCIIQISKSFAFKEQALKAHTEFQKCLEQSREAQSKTQTEEFEFEDSDFSIPFAAHEEPPSVPETAPKKSFECNVCKKTFVDAKALIRHHKIHLTKSFKCNECGLMFADKSNLKKHMKTHTGELRAVVGKPHLCAECGKSFKWRSSLVKHFRHHSRSRIFQCNLCPKYYVEMKGLNQHRLLHTGERPFECSIEGCGKTFRQKGHLDKHLRSHSSNVKLKCSACPKKFKQRSSLEKHLKSCTGSQKWNCQRCNASFDLHQSMAAHWKTHLREKPKE